MKKAVAVCGHISSGKSSIIHYLSKTYGWDTVSFGSFVRREAEARNLPSTRQAYQDLGFELFSNLGASKFLEQVVAFHQPRSTTHLFDGVRHPSIVTALRNLYGSVFVAYLAVEDRMRYERFLARLAPQDEGLSFEEFLAISRHPIEQGISDLAPIADIVTDASLPLTAIISQTEEALSASGFL